MRRRWADRALQVIGRGLIRLGAWLQARAEPPPAAPVPEADRPLDPASGEPPAHWLALMRARAPGFLLRGARTRIPAPSSRGPLTNDVAAAAFGTHAPGESGRPEPDDPSAGHRLRDSHRSVPTGQPRLRISAPEPSDSPSPASQAESGAVAEPNANRTPTSVVQAPGAPQGPGTPLTRHATPAPRAVPAPPPPSPVTTIDEVSSDTRPVPSPVAERPAVSSRPNPWPPVPDAPVRRPGPELPDEDLRAVRAPVHQSAARPPNGLDVALTLENAKAPAGGADQRPPLSEWPALVAGAASRAHGTVLDEDAPRPSRPALHPDDDVETDLWPELPEMEWPQWHDDLMTLLREENRRRRLRAEQAGFSWSGPLS